MVVDPFNPHPQKRTQHMHVAHDEDDDIDVCVLAVKGIKHVFTIYKLTDAKTLK